MASSARQPAPKGRSRSTLAVLFSVIIIDLISFGIVIPILPAYAKTLEASATVLGLIVATHAALQALFAPFWGRLSDRIGRRPVMLVTMAGTSAALLMLGLAESIAALFAARVLSGLFAANISVATAYVADVTDESERTRWMGMIGASFGIGFILGPLLGGLLAPYGYGVPMFVAAGMAALNCAYATLVLKEPPRHSDKPRGRGGLALLRTDPYAAQLCFTNLLFTVGVSQLEVTFFYLMNERFGYGIQQVAFILVAMALVMAGIQGGGMRALAERFGEKRLLVTGLFCMALAFPAIPRIGSVGLLLVPLGVAAAGRAIAQPPMTSLISMRTDSMNRGAVMGAYQSAAAIARIIGPMLAGLLYDFRTATPFYLAASLFVVSALLSMRLRDVDAAPKVQPA
ncbi:MAG: MFS transporter [Deltaproteobacteria bacterium]|nr:MFS transporter [Deltaproteobacteria bacterium]